MTGKNKTLLFALIISLPFWWAINTLEKELSDIFFWQELSRRPDYFTAQISFAEHIRDLKPILNKETQPLELHAKSALSLLIKNNGQERILFSMREAERLPIASLTKLMTANVVLEHYDLSKEVVISNESIAQEEDFGKLTAGKSFTVKYLLYPLLMESSNDAAFALANDYDGLTEEKFVELMNLKAMLLSLDDTFFYNVTGLDIEEPEELQNHSSTIDLAEIVKDLLKEPLVWEILLTNKYNIYGPELINTNALLKEIPEIIGGKTGYTEKAGGCMILVLKAPKNSGIIINVILGTNGTTDRFEEMKKLVDWAKNNYRW